MDAESTVFLLGAGFSRCVSDGQTPLMAGFFDRLEPARFANLHAFVTDMAGDRTRANVEEVIGTLDQLEDVPLTDLGSMARWARSAEQVRRELGDYCIQRLCCARWRADHWATCVLASADSNTTVITTNYDNIAESILSAKIDATHHHAFANCHHCRMRRILLEDCDCAPTPRPDKPDWRGSVLKLHGSVAWKTCLNRRCRRYECLIADQHCRPFDGRPCECCAQPCQPVIVLPSQRKHYSRYAHLNRMWDAAAKALSEAEYLIVFGFSFPSSDCLIRLMLRQAASQRRLKRVAVVDVAPDPVAERVRQVLPSDQDVAVDTFVVPTDGSVPAWWAAEASAEPGAS